MLDNKLVFSGALAVFLLGGGYVAYVKYHGVCSQEAYSCRDGSLVGRGGPRCDIARCPDGNEPLSRSGQLQKSQDFDTADWKTYHNEKYGFEMKYPATWEAQTDPVFILSGFSHDIVALVPPLAEFQSCATEAQELKENYRSHNPFSGYEKYAESLERTYCGITIGLEENTAGLPLEAFLRKQYHFDGRFIVHKEDRIEKMTTKDYSFSSAMGYTGGVGVRGVAASGSQGIAGFGGKVFFMNNNVRNHSGLQETGDTLFSKVVDSFRIFTK